jgi:hypothetical protein
MFENIASIVSNVPKGHRTFAGDKHWPININPKHNFTLCGCLIHTYPANFARNDSLQKNTSLSGFPPSPAAIWPYAPWVVD